MPEGMNEESRRKLHEVGVATLTTCLFRRGFKNTYLRGVVPVRRDLSRMVGEAFTLRFIPAREDIGQMAAYANELSIHQRAFEECPSGHVLVIDTHYETEACTCGNLLVARLKTRGAAGVVTDGGYRDSPEITKLGFPAYHSRPAPAPSFLHLHAVELNQPIGCAKVAIYPGDIIVGDDEGVVAIPAHLANEVAAEAHALTLYEVFAAEKISQGRSIFGLYPATDASRAEYLNWDRTRRR
jgi:regulator of RNase E activity RraA